MVRHEKAEQVKRLPVDGFGNSPEAPVSNELKCELDVTLVSDTGAGIAVLGYDVLVDVEYVLDRRILALVAHRSGRRDQGR